MRERSSDDKTTQHQETSYPKKRSNEYTSEQLSVTHKKSRDDSQAENPNINLENFYSFFDHYLQQQINIISGWHEWHAQAISSTDSDKYIGLIIKKAPILSLNLVFANLFTNLANILSNQENLYPRFTELKQRMDLLKTETYKIFSSVRDNIEKKSNQKDLGLSPELIAHKPKNPGQVYNPNSDYKFILPRFWLNHIDKYSMQIKISDMQTVEKFINLFQIDNTDLFTKNFCKKLIDSLFYEFNDLNIVNTEKLFNEVAKGTSDNSSPSQNLSLSFTDLFSSGANYTDITAKMKDELDNVINYSPKQLSWEIDSLPCQPKADLYRYRTSSLIRYANSKEKEIAEINEKLINEDNIQILSGIEIEFGLKNNSSISPRIDYVNNTKETIKAAIIDYLYKHPETKTRIQAIANEANKLDPTSSLRDIYINKFMAEKVSSLNTEECFLYDLIFIGDESLCEYNSTKKIFYFPECDTMEKAIIAIAENKFASCCLDMDYTYEIASRAQKIEESYRSYFKVLDFMLKKTSIYGLELSPMPSVQINLSFNSINSDHEIIENLCLPQISSQVNSSKGSVSFEEPSQIFLNRKYLLILAGIKATMDYLFTFTDSDFSRNQLEAKVKFDVKEGVFDEDISSIQEFISSPYILDRYYKWFPEDEKISGAIALIKELNWYQIHREISAKDAAVRGVVGKKQTARCEIRMVGHNNHLSALSLTEGVKETDPLYIIDILMFSIVETCKLVIKSEEFQNQSKNPELFLLANDCQPFGASVAELKQLKEADFGTIYDKCYTHISNVMALENSNRSNVPIIAHKEIENSIDGFIKEIQQRYEATSLTPPSPLQRLSSTTSSQFSRSRTNSIDLVKSYTDQATQCNIEKDSEHITKN